MTSQARDPDLRRSGGSIGKSIRKNIPLVLFFIFAAGTMLVVYSFFRDESEPNESNAGFSVVESAQFEFDAPIAPINKPRNTKLTVSIPAQSATSRKVGIIAGHRGSDSGTECQDGLTEVQVTSDIAERVADRLGQSNIEADTLDEFDDLLENYSASVLISIHVDSCDYINDEATGFKIAGSPFTDSSALTICVQHAYEAATGLSYHPNSVTPHMSEYHAFREISPGTPALIIEIGFLNLDREILTIGSDSVVDGLVNGLLCYLES